MQGMMQDSRRKEAEKIRGYDKVKEGRMNQKQKRLN